MAFGLSFALRGNQTFSRLFFGLDAVSGDTFYRIVWLYLVIFPFVPPILESQGFYNRRMTGSRPVMIWSLIRGCFIVTIGLVLFIYLLKLVVPRGVVTLFGIISFGLVFLKEEIMRWVLNSRLAKSQYQRRIILAGIPSEMARLRQMLESRAPDTIAIAAEHDIAMDAPSHLIELLHEHSASGVLVSARHSQLDRVEGVIQLCEIEGVEAWLVADFFTTQIARASFDEILGQPLLIFRSTPETSWQMLAKNLLDFAGALILLIILGLTVMPVVALLIKITSPGPVFFRQQRSGLNGAPFNIWKFRTMATNSEQFKHELESMNEMRGPVFKITKDPRITPLGKWLRKYSLDELPQLFNVLRGEMSLVGPRPLPVDEVKRFNDLAHRRRLSVKPGLTCLWQVSGRNQISDFKDWVRLDLEYIDNWSIWLDLLILLRTIPAVFTGTGAK
jgi:exopolysaccharide biosynthesis polyprenyl glycosylphosphotransferase